MGLIGLLLVTLTACDPFSQKTENNQFSMEKKQLIFMGHRLGHWPNKTIPQCMLCSLSIYTIKMAPDLMLFKQINDERGDLFFLVAKNVSHSFAMKTGVYSYSIVLKIEVGSVTLNVDKQPAFSLVVNQKQKVILGGNSYFIELQDIDNKYGAVDINIWSEIAIK